MTTTPSPAPTPEPATPLEASNPAGPPEGTETPQHTVPPHTTTEHGDTTPSPAAEHHGSTDTTETDLAPTLGAPAPTTLAALPRTCPASYCNQAPGHPLPHGWIQNDPR